MKILIIGQKGYIGSALWNYLANLDFELYGCDIGWFSKDSPNINNVGECAYTMFPEAVIGKMDAVILLAGYSSVQMCTDYYKTMQANVMDAFYLMKRLKPGQKFIYISSASVYGKNFSPYENHEYDVLHASDNFYDQSKQLLDKMMENCGLDYYGLRLATVNGPSPNMRIDLMLNSMTYSALTEGVVKVANYHTPRSILHIRDLCKAIRNILLFNKKSPGIYNLASFTSTIGEMAETVAKLHKVPLEYLPNSSTYTFKLNTSKFESTFRWHPHSTLRSTIFELSDVDYIKIQENPNNYRRLYAR